MLYTYFPYLSLILVAPEAIFFVCEEFSHSIILFGGLGLYKVGYNINLVGNILGKLIHSGFMAQDTTLWAILSGSNINIIICKHTCIFNEISVNISMFYV